MINVRREIFPDPPQRKVCLIICGIAIAKMEQRSEVVLLAMINFIALLKKQLSSSRFLRPSTRYAIYAINSTSLDTKHTLLVYLLPFKSKRIQCLTSEHQ